MSSHHDLAATATPHWLPAGLMQGLGTPFAAPVAPMGLPEPHWVARNEALAAEWGLAGWLHSSQALALLSGNGGGPQQAPAQLATVYSGHQFGVWAGQLGDGRALLLGEVATPAGAIEWQLKGSGLTPYSRMGDGRAVLRSSIREYLGSEAMHALGIPTTRALALVGSALPVRREAVETAAIVTRTAPSFLRFGHFEHWAHTARDAAALQTLVDAVIDRFEPDCRNTAAGAALPALAWLQRVVERTADLIAMWQAVGFCHGVMNTDNLSVLGLTIDYGPFGFMDGFDPHHICNHSDHEGRYAWDQQPQVGLWNCHALATALLPLIDDRSALLAVLDGYKPRFVAAQHRAFAAKLGLRPLDAGEDTGRDSPDAVLINDWLALLARCRADFSICHRRLAAFDSTAGAANDGANDDIRDLFLDRTAFDAWAERYAARLRQEHSHGAERALRMNAVNPKFVLRNHLAETAIRQAQAGDFTEVQRLARVLSRPFDEQPEHEADASFPPAWASGLEVSCSS